MPPTETHGQRRYRNVEFETAGALPRARPGEFLDAVRFHTCPGSNLCVQRIGNNSNDCDAHGMAKDSWWRVGCAGLPNRILRLFGGSHSMSELLHRYGFLDASGCVNHRNATASYTAQPKLMRSAPAGVPAHLADATGVPQFYARSGVCWFAALCTTSFADPSVRRFLQSHMPPDLARLCDRCLSDRGAAQAFRNRLWHDYAVGDDVEKPPELDGCNGFYEFAVLAAKLEIPMLIYENEGDRFYAVPPTVSDKKVPGEGRSYKIRKPKSYKEQHLLVLRFRDGDHVKFPIRRRVVFSGCRYRLVGFYGGQRKCGHQIGIASTTGNWRDMMIGDADLHKDGIGPVFVRFDGPEWVPRWWDAWRELVLVTKFGPGRQEFCNLNPWNEPDDSLDTGCRRMRRGCGKNSLDLIYMSDTRAYTPRLNDAGPAVGGGVAAAAA